MSTSQQPRGFYPTNEANTQRYWNGSEFEGQAYPIPPKLDVWRIAAGTAMGTSAGALLLGLLFGIGLFG